MPIKPYSTMGQSGGSSGSVTSVNGLTGAVVVSKTTVGLQYAQNLAPADYPISTATQAAITQEHTDMIARSNLYIQLSKMAAADGVATLDATGTLTTAQIPSSLLAGLKWMGVWNATTNSPTLSATPSANGNFYRVSVAGTSSIPTGSSVSYNVGDWLISGNNGTVWQYIVNTLSDATTVTKGVVQLAGDLAGGAASPLVAKLGGVAIPAAAPTAAGKYLRSTSTTATEYASIPATDLPSATTVAAGVLTLGGDLAGTATAQSVKALDGYSIGNTPTTVNQVLAVTDIASKTLGYVSQSGGGGVEAAYIFATRATQTTGLTAGSYILFSTTEAQAGSGISLNTATGVFTLVAGRTYQLSCSIPFMLFSQAEAYASAQWYNITAGTVIGTEGATQPITRVVNEGKTCVFEAIITPSVNTQVAARFTPISGTYMLTGIYNAMANIQVLAGSAPITGQSVDYVLCNPTNTWGAYTDMPLTKVTGNLSVSTPYITLLAGKTYYLEAFISLRGCVWFSYNFVDSANVALPGVVVGQSAAFSSADTMCPVPAAGFFTPSVNTQVKLRLGNIGTGTTEVDTSVSKIIVRQVGTSSVIDMIGATSTTAGVKGTVPAPAIGEQRDYLRGDGTWDDTAWTSYTPTITGSITNPTLATTKTLLARYRVVGKNLQIAFTYYAASATGAAAGSGAYLFSLPAGFSINTSVAPLASVVNSTAGSMSGVDASTLGAAQVGLTTSASSAVVVGTSTTTVGLFLGFSSTGTVYNTLVGSTIAQLSNAGCYYKFTAEVPIIA